MRRTCLVASFCTLVAGLVVLAPVSVSASARVTTRAEPVTVVLSGTRTVTLERPADSVAVYWRGQPGARVTLALSSDGSNFTRPRDAGRDELGEQRGNGTTYGAVHAAHGATAVRVTSDRPLARVTVLGLSDGAVQLRPQVRSATAEAAVDQPPVSSRAQWGADESLMTWAPQFYPTRKLVVHHTATSNDYADESAAQTQIRSIYYYHAVTQGWGDIGYNFLIDKFGTIYEGRYSRAYQSGYPTGDDANGDGVTGAHTSGWNSGTVGVALLGTHTDRDITPAARESLERLLAWEAARNGIDPTATEPFTNPVSGATITTPNIAGHRDYVATECPGGTLYATMPALRTDVASRIAAGGGGAGADTVAPSAPGSLTATGGRKSVALGWAESSDDSGSVAGYRIWRAGRASGTFSQVGTTTRTSYTDAGLARRTTYYYKVQAYDAAGNVSAFSAVASARTS